MQTRPILVIDDDPALCELVSSVLTDAGFKVLSAPDGLSGIALARAARPALILLDMIMSGLDGVGTCQRLKQDGVLSRTPVVAITASSDLRYIEQAFCAGAEFFLSKPIRAEILTQVVGLAVQRTRRETPRRAHPRFPAELPVRCVIREATGHTVNASLGGLQLSLSERLAPGTVFRVELGLPTGVVTAEAKVIWQREEIGTRLTSHGVQILRFVEDTGFLQYKQFLKQVAASTAGRMTVKVAPRR